MKIYKRLKINPYNKLFELRKNPDKNPFVGAWDYLEKYKSDPDVYISFTNVNKIGINPQSKYNTPVGIYCYPLRQFVDKYLPSSMETDILKYTQSIGKYAPFAGNSKYINFIKLKDKSNFINDMYTDYGSNDYDRDIKILKNKYKLEILSKKEIENFIKNFEDVIKDHDIIHNTNAGKIIGLADKKNELSLGVRNKIKLSLLAKYNSWDTKDKELVKYLRLSLNNLVKNNGFNSLEKNALITARDKNPISSMWNVTRLLAGQLSKGDKQASTKWNLILSNDLGYSGFADKSGKGYIHSSEPMQAVFLRKSVFSLISREENKPSKDLKKKVRIIKFEVGDKFEKKNGEILTIEEKQGNKYGISSNKYEKIEWFPKDYIVKVLIENDYKKIG